MLTNCCIIDTCIKNTTGQRMSLFLDEKELVKEFKEQGVLPDAVKALYEYKIFGFVPVKLVILSIPLIMIIKKAGK